MELKTNHLCASKGTPSDDWEPCELGEYARFRTGPFGSSLHASDYTTDGIPLINPMHIVDGRLVPSPEMTVSEDTAKRLSDFRMLPGDVVIGRRGDMGRCATVRAESSGWVCGTGSMLIRVNQNFHPNFLQRVLSSADAVKQITEASVGSTMTNLNQATLSRVKLKKPPIKEQVAIANALSDVDSLLAKLDQLIAKKVDIKKGAMQELLTGKRRLPGFSGAWATQKLGAISHIKTGSKNNQDKVSDGAYPFFVRSANVEKINSYSYDCEAILVPGEGGIGSIFHYINGKFDVHQRVYAITNFTQDAYGKYVYLYMKEKFGAHAMTNSVKATVDSLRLPTFKNFDIKLPPTIDEQVAIATVLFDIDAELNALISRRAKLANIKQGMMQQLLTGKIRLV